MNKSVLKISDATAIALHSLSLIYKNRELLSAKEIAETLDVSYHHLSKVLQRLVKTGYLSSTKGAKGGFEIIKTNISLLEIYETFEGKLDLKDCILYTKNHVKNTVMFDLLKKIDNEVYQYLKNKKISDV